MSDKKTILEKVQDLATFIMKGNDKKVKLAQETLDNETVIEAEVFEAGQPVFIVNEEERVPLPVGDYTLKDGRALVVVEEGMIDTIGEAAEEEEVDANSEFVTKPEFNKAIDEIKSMLSKDKKAEDDLIIKAKADLKKAEEDLKLSKENVVKLQKEIDEIPDAKKIIVAPVKLKNNPATTMRGRIVEHLNKIA